MSRSRTANRTDRRYKAVLTIGYLAITVAVLGAFLSPATDYELDIYAATPTVFWLGLGVAVATSLFVSFYAPRGYLSTASLVLGGSSMLAASALPLMRGYVYIGTGDAMTHLGWVRDIINTSFSPFGLFYPGLHTVSIAFHRLVGFSPNRSIMFFVLCVIAAYFVFVPLCVRSITGQDGPMLIGVFAAFLVLPLNQVATHYSAHPITDTVLLSPIVLYVLVQYLLASPDPDADARPGAFDSIPTVSLLLAVVSIAVVLYHPQQAANTIILFGTISAVQFAAHRYGASGRIRAHRTLYGQTTFLVIAFFVWAGSRDTFRRAFGTILTEIAGLVLEGSDDAAQIVQQRGGSLSAIGASATELFLKLFFVSALFAALVALLMLISLLGDNDQFDPDTTGLLRYFSVGLIVLVPYSFAFFVGVASNLFFRNLGFIMAIATILGAIAIHRYVAALSEMVAPERIRLATVMVLGFMLVLSTAVLFPSPYIFQASGHVSDDRMSGYQTAFEHQNDSVDIYSVREGPWRFRDAIAGVENVDSSRYSDQGYYGDNITHLRDLSPEDRYFLYTGASVAEEIEVFRQLRFSSEQFGSLSRQPGVSRVQTSDEVFLYYVNSNNTTAPESSTSMRSPAPSTDAGSGLDGDPDSDPSADVEAGPSTGTEVGSGAGTDIRPPRADGDTRPAAGVISHMPFVTPLGSRFGGV